MESLAGVKEVRLGETAHTEDMRIACQILGRKLEVKGPLRIPDFCDVTKCS
jgi:hypothetical protein